jgi:hypothetical protein
MSNDDVVLILPPLWDPYGPAASTAALVGHGRAQGLRMSQIDVNQRYFVSVCSQVMHSALEDIRHEQTFATAVPYEHKVVLGSLEYDPHPMMRWGIDESDLRFHTFRSRISGWKPQRLNILDALLHYGYFVRQLRSMGSVLDDPSGIHDTAWGALHRVFHESVVPEILKRMPAIVGFSILGEQQLAPTIACSKWLRERYDGVIVWGGSHIRQALELAQEGAWWKELPDHMCLGEGETALVQLALRARQGTTRADDIPGWTSAPYRTSLFPRKHFERVSSLAVPVYEGLDLANGYLMPEPVIPYQASRGCHWGKCAFCDHEEGYRLHYRPKSVQQVVDDLDRIRQTTGATHVQLVDEAVEPAWLAQLLDELEARGLTGVFRWSHYSKVSSDVTEELMRRAYDAGCRVVLFGVETFNPRLIKLVKKGTSNRAIIDSIKNTRMAGIRPCIWLISGLPTQTPEELHSDIQQMEALFPSVDSAMVGRYRISKNSDIYRSPEAFGIVSYDISNPMDVVCQLGAQIIEPETLARIYKDRYYPASIAGSLSHNRYVVFQDALNAECEAGAADPIRTIDRLAAASE